MDESKYTKLLRTYARSMTRGNATNGSLPWIGENIEPDKGFWVARRCGGIGNADVVLLIVVVLILLFCSVVVLPI